MTPQQRKLLSHFRRSKRITGRLALMDYGIQALPKRISELRELGHDITASWKKHPATGQRYREYVYNRAAV